MDNKALRAKFSSLFGSAGDLYFSPGRINLIGEHTDYNGGFVLPGAIDKGMLAEIKVNAVEKYQDSTPYSPATYPSVQASPHPQH